jgi:hypothetical protein
MNQVSKKLGQEKEIDSSNFWGVELLDFEDLGFAM